MRGFCLFFPNFLCDSQCQGAARMGLPHSAAELGTEGAHRSSSTRVQSHRTWAGWSGGSGRVHQQSWTSQGDEPHPGSPAGRQQQEMAQKQGYGIGSVSIEGTGYKGTTFVSLGSLQENQSLNEGSWGQGQLWCSSGRDWRLRPELNRAPRWMSRGHVAGGPRWGWAELNITA